VEFQRILGFRAHQKTAAAKAQATAQALSRLMSNTRGAGHQKIRPLDTSVTNKLCSAILGEGTGIRQKCLNYFNAPKDCCAEDNNGVQNRVISGGMVMAGIIPAHQLMGKNNDT